MALGMGVHYVKPHGALYNQACRDRELADLFVIAAAQFHLPVVGLPGFATRSRVRRSRRRSSRRGSPTAATGPTGRSCREPNPMRSSMTPTKP